MRHFRHHDDEPWVPVHRVGVHLGLSFRHYLAGMVAIALLIFPLVWFAGFLTALATLAAQSLGSALTAPAIQRLTNLLTLGSVILLLGAVVTQQGRSLMSLVAPGRPLDLAMMVRSAATYALAFLPVLVMSVMSGQLAPGDWRAALPLLPVLLVLVALQATAEEMVCRGYMTQGFQVLLGHAALAALPVALIFLALHRTGGWDEGWDRKAGILMFSLALSWLTVRSGRLEPAMGVHFAHNMIVFMLAARPESGLPAIGMAEDRPTGPLRPTQLLVQMLVYGAVCANYWFIGLRTGYVVHGWSAAGEEPR